MQNSKLKETLKVSGDVPLPRFGHTMTLISKNKAVLFGGATGDTGKYSITGETFLLDCITQKWKRLEPSGSAPTNRAAHAATAIETNQIFIYGGATGGGGLAPDDLYLLDLKNGEDNARWIIVPVEGTTPGPRYGHVMSYSRPFIVVFGGNTGNEAVNDVWVLNVEKSPLFWTKLEIIGDKPPTRVYHSAALCSKGTANGMIVIFGGRTQDQSALNDSWGLRRHRDGSWDWVKAPYKPDSEPPIARYQHSTLFNGSQMLVIGGRTNNVMDTVPLEVYDCESSGWTKLPSIQRFRHASWLIENMLYVYGGFEESPNIPTESVARWDMSRHLQLYDQPIQPVMNQTNVSMSETRSSSPFGNRYEMRGTNNNENQGNVSFIQEPSQNRVKKPSTAGFGRSKQVRMSENVWVVTPHNLKEGKDIIRNVSIMNLPEESKKLPPGYNHISNGKSLYYESLYNPFLVGLMKPAKFSQNTEGKFPFKIEQIHKLIDECLNLFANEEEVPTVLRLRIPIKIFGNIHGQYSDLMRLFDHWGAPTDDGDIEGFDYLFLGNYVDRGRSNLEILCLLFALKLKYPDQFHLLRGSNEDIKINRTNGFGEECASRLGENIDDPKSIFQRFNKLFEYLPLAATIQDKILCVHSGIGNSLSSVQELESLSRPIEVAQDSFKRDQQLVWDLLWSDPVQGDDILSRNKMGYDIKTPVKYGQERLKNFLMDNDLSMVIRSHECVSDGFERLWGGALITCFSATDYNGKFGNAAAVVVIKKNSTIIPKLIYPLQHTTQTGSFGGPDEGKFAGKTFGNFGMGNNNSLSGMQVTMGGNSNWVDNDETLKRRPATPPRYGTKGSFKKTN